MAVKCKLYKKVEMNMMKKMRYVMASVMTVVGLMLPLTHAQDGGWSEVNQVENAWSQVGQAPASNTSSKDGWGGVVESGSGNPSTNANDAGDGGGGTASIGSSCGVYVSQYQHDTNMDRCVAHTICNAVVLAISIVVSRGQGWGSAVGAGTGGAIGTNACSVSYGGCSPIYETRTSVCEHRWVSDSTQPTGMRCALYLCYGL
jgi:hypothetical protein